MKAFRVLSGRHSNTKKGLKNLTNLLAGFIQPNKLLKLISPYIISVLNRLIYFRGYKIRIDLENRRLANFIAFEKASQDLIIETRRTKLKRKLQVLSSNPSPKLIKKRGREKESFGEAEN